MGVQHVSGGVLDKYPGLCLKNVRHAIL